MSPWLRLGFALAPQVAAAQTPESEPKPEAEPMEDESLVDVDGEWRVIASSLSDFPVDDSGAGTGQGRWLDHRLRTGLSGPVSPLIQAAAQLDLATGTLVADPWLLEGTPDDRDRYTLSAVDTRSLVFRRVSATTVLGNTQIEAGLVTSTWGLGLVANDGAIEPLFGRSDFGDHTLRIRATNLPSGDGPPPRTSWLTTAALDLVVADEIAALATGEQAMQGIVSVLALGRRGSRAGAYLVGRQQWEREPGRTTQALVLDGFGEAWHPLGEETRLRTAAEVAGITGRTNRATTYAARDHVGLLSLGAVGQLTLDVRDEQLRVHLFTGYASGDGDPDDGISKDFAFDRDYGVGMVLFDEVMAGIEGASWIRVNDPEIAGQPPDGAELLVTEGSVRRASFLQPAMQVKPHPWLEFGAGMAFAWSTAYVSHPLLTARNGGVPTNHLGVEVDSRFLGGELDWSIGVMRPESEEAPDRVRYGFGLQGGHLGVGPALDGPGMPAMVSLLTGSARMTW